MNTIDISERLLSGERLLWSGRPAQGVLFTPRDLFLVPFSLLWGGFAIFWEASVMASHRAPIFFQLWGIPFVLAGLYLIAGRFFVDAYLRSGMVYALTTRRVLIYRPRPSYRFTALDLTRLPDMQLSLRQDGSGTIRFGVQQAGRGGTWSPALDVVPQFIGIADAEAVFDRIQRQADPARNLPAR